MERLLKAWTCENQITRKGVIKMAEFEEPFDPNLREFSDERLMGFDDNSEVDSDSNLTRKTEDSVDGEVQPPRRPTTWFDCTLTVPKFGNGNSERDFF